MKFDDFDIRMRVFETAHDVCVLPGIYMAARLDGRSFTHLTKDVCNFAVPFDAAFRDLMMETAKHLMSCGLTVVYGYTQSDEISLLFDRNENAFSRKHRKFNSILAGEASAKFTALLGRHAAFDCRLCELPNKEVVVDYFRWRAADAHRNALNSYCFCRLREDGMSARGAAKKLFRVGMAEKNELLFSYGINSNDLPAWQKRGIGLYWELTEKEGFNPKIGEKTLSQRRRIHVDMELPCKEAYEDFLLKLLASA